VSKLENKLFYLYGEYSIWQIRNTMLKILFWHLLASFGTSMNMMNSAFYPYNPYQNRYIIFFLCFSFGDHIWCYKPLLFFINGILLNEIFYIDLNFRYTLPILILNKTNKAIMHETSKYNILISCFNKYIKLTEICLSFLVLRDVF
jgi:hypothetical protein